MHNAYEARDPDDVGWPDRVAQWPDGPPVGGPDQWPPPQPAHHDGFGAPPDTARFDERSAGAYGGPEQMTGRPAPDPRRPRPPVRDDVRAGARDDDPQAPPGRGGHDDDAGMRTASFQEPPQPPMRDRTGHAPPPPGPSSFDPQGAQRSVGDHGGGRRSDRSLRERTGHAPPPPAPVSFDPQGARRSPGHPGDRDPRGRGAPDGRPDPQGGEHQGFDQAGDRMPDREQAEREPYVESATPPGQQLRASVDRASTTVRRSVPLRTLLFLLPPLALPPLAFDLSFVATLVVALTLLWTAAAAGVFCTIMLEGRQDVALRPVERGAPSGGDGAADTDTSLQEALVAIGAQLDRLDDRVEALSAGAAARGDDLRVLSDRPQEHVPNTLRDEQYDRYGQTAVPDTNWSESRWRR